MGFPDEPPGGQVFFIMICLHVRLGPPTQVLYTFDWQATQQTAGSLQEDQLFDGPFKTTSTGRRPMNGLFWRSMLNGFPQVVCRCHVAPRTNVGTCEIRQVTVEAADLVLVRSDLRDLLASRHWFQESYHWGMVMVSCVNSYMTMSFS